MGDATGAFSIPSSTNEPLPKLFQPTRVGELQLSHRVVHPPLTRLRVNRDGVPTDIVATYYGQRASVRGTLLIAEATSAGPKAGMGPWLPTIFTDEQVAGWKKVVDAVHAKGSFIFLQIWAGGRATVAAYFTAPPPAGLEVLAPSPIPLPGFESITPREMTKEDIDDAIDFYVQAAVKAVHGAGFDGVELHGANGYLIDQFLQDMTNKRTDDYGGSVENRARFTLELVRAVSKAIGIQKTALRISPWSKDNGMCMEDPIPTFSHLVRKLAQEFSELAYLHVIEPGVDGISDNEVRHGSNDFIRDIWLPRPLITAGRYYRKEAIERAEQTGELIGMGRLFMSNPDLPLKLLKDLPLAKWSRDNYYVLEEPRGYIDYPFADYTEVKN